MGKGASQPSQQTSGTTTQTVERTQEQRDLDKLQLEREKFLDPQIRDVQSTGLTLTQQMLSGSSPLPGWLSQLERGIDPAVTQGIVDQSMRDVDARMAGSGLLDSGTRASILSRTSGDIRRASEESNIGTKLNLLNLALSGQAQVQQPIVGFSSNLGQRLDSAASRTQTGNTYATQSRPSSGFSFF